MMQSRADCPRGPGHGVLPVPIGLTMASLEAHLSPLLGCVVVAVFLLGFSTLRAAPSAQAATVDGFVDVNGGRIYYEMRGAGTPIILFTTEFSIVRPGTSSLWSLGVLLRRYAGITAGTGDRRPPVSRFCTSMIFTP